MRRAGNERCAGTGGTAAEGRGDGAGDRASGHRVPHAQRDFRAVDDASLRLERGRTLCVVGESGSGKSVTARSILQILDPPGRIASGRILLHRHLTAKAIAGDETIDLATLDPRGRIIRAIRGRDIAMIFQEPMSSLSLVHTIGNQIGEALRLHEQISKKEARERTIDLLQRVEIPRPERAIDRYPFEYSGGMRQRAIIAMALACNPGVLIADEPTTALDVTTQAEILDLIKELQQQFGMAVMFITHDMGVVAEIADDVVVMRHGKLVEQGPVERIFHAPQHDYTKMLLNAAIELDKPSPRRLAMRAHRPPGTPILELRHLRKVYTSSAGRLFRRTFDELAAVDDVDLTLHAGESLGIVGESGSGKTTLGRCILRVLDPTGGEIRYHDDGTTLELANANAAMVQRARREIRMIFPPRPRQPVRRRRLPT
jgi:peptide/nickel transport system ATP-binding protein